MIAPTTRSAYVGRPAKIKSKRPWLTALTTFGLLAIAVCCFAPRALDLFGNKPAIASLSTKASTSKSTLITKPIEEIRCGDRIPSQLPSGVETSNDEIPNQATWRMVELEIDKKDGEKLQARLLRPLAWLEQAGAIREGTFPISIEELEVEGEAAVLRVLPCPRIQSGEGQVVTGTFKHSCDEFVTLSIANQSDTITCTTGHPIWSEDRQDFIDAADLKQGESVRLAESRLSIVTNSHRFRQSQSVYNLEVNTTHVYYVGSEGLLVHNAVEKCTKTAYHGTDRDSALKLLNGGRLDGPTAAKLKIDGPPGFFMATLSEEAKFFAVRRENPVLLQMQFSDHARAKLDAAGLVRKQIPRGKTAVFEGDELIVSPEMFGLFNSLLDSGDIKISPAR